MAAMHEDGKRIEDKDSSYGETECQRTFWTDFAETISSHFPIITHQMSHNSDTLLFAESGTLYGQPSSR